MYNVNGSGTTTPRAILRAIRDSGMLARVDLADRLGLSAATVTKETAILIEAGLLRETPHEPSVQVGRGRPRVGLTLNPRAFLVVGVRLAEQSLSLAVLDFSGQTVASHVSEQSLAGLSPENLAGRIAEVLESVLTEVGLLAGDIAELGLGIPGFVAHETGKVHWSPLLDRRNVDFRDVVSQRIGLPVSIDNDANLATLAELWFGKGRERSDFLVVTVENGIGAGLVSGGRLYRGARGLGMEFGHTCGLPEGAPCRCGLTGCIETVASDHALAREFRAAFPNLSDLAQEAALERLFAMVEDEDATAIGISRTASRYLGSGLASLVNLIDPPLLILSGSRVRFSLRFAQDAIGFMQERLLRTDRDPPEIIMHRRSDMLWTKGSAALALHTATDRISLAGNGIQIQHYAAK